MAKAPIVERFVDAGDTPWIRFGNVIAPLARVAYASIHEGFFIDTATTESGNQCLAQDGADIDADAIMEALVDEEG